MQNLELEIPHFAITRQGKIRSKNKVYLPVPTFSIHGYVLMSLFRTSLAEKLSFRFVAD